MESAIVRSHATRPSVFTKRRLLVNLTRGTSHLKAARPGGGYSKCRLSLLLGLLATSPEDVAGGSADRTAGVSLLFSLTPPSSRTNITFLCRRNLFWLRFGLTRRLRPKS
jgi:hypothetical protein